MIARVLGGSVCLALAALTLIAAPQIASAQGSPPGEPPMFDFLLPTDGLNADVGGGLSLHPKVLGTSHTVGDPVPVLEVQWGEDAHFSLVDGATWTPLRFGPLALGPVVEFKQDYANPRLAHGLRNADNWEAGGLARLMTPIGQIEGRLRHSLDGDDTKSADLSFDTAIKTSPRMTLALEVRGSWSNEAFVIPGHKTRKNTNPPPIDMSTDFYSAGAQVAAIYRADGGWLVTGIVSKDEIVSAEKKTLKFSTRSVPIVSLVITHRFRLF